MTPEETKTLLAKAALTDARTVDLASIRAWHEIISKIPFDYAMAALENHRRESSEYLQPAHIVQGARRIHAQREAAANRARAIEATRAIESAPAAPAAQLTERAIKNRIHSDPRLQAKFDAARLEGNAMRAYWTVLRETGDNHKALEAADLVRNGAVA